jgi:hypothetical protein
MPQIRLRPFMAPDNADFRPIVKAAARIALPKCHARRRSGREAQIAIAGAAETMKLNRELGPGGAHART